MKITIQDKKKINNEQLPQILVRMFGICKQDSNFSLNPKINDVENEISELNNKLKHQRKVMENTNNVKNDLSNRLQDLRSKNFELKVKLLEDLGSEL